MRTYPTRARLPAPYSAHIGRVVTRWSLPHATLRQVGYALLQVNPKLGHTMVQEPRIADHVTMIEDAMTVLSLKTSVDTKELKKGLKTLDEIQTSWLMGFGSGILKPPFPL